jgi:pyrophosphatase PpaX
MHCSGKERFIPIMRPKQAILFDWDGTLFDSGEMVRQSTYHAIREVLGLEIDADTVNPWFGRTLEVQFQGLVPHADGPLVERLVAAYRHHNVTIHDALARPVPGAVELVQELHGAGYRLAIVSSKRVRMVERGLQVLGLTAYFPVVVGMESAPRHKPDPAPVEAALEAWPDLPRSRVVMVGDSPYDMASATAAGVDAVGLLSNTFSREALFQAGASAVLDRLQELRTWLGLDKTGSWKATEVRSDDSTDGGQP